MVEDGLWYKDAIIYQLHVKAFLDSTNDGVGDFAGLTQKLDYIQDLGVTAIWLLPFYPSPLRDDGYDIADYRDVHPGYGSIGEFTRFVREAHRRNLRVITELVVNHTSDQHPWFQRARRAAPGSAWRNYYVWSDTDQKYSGTRIIFNDTETSNWAWDPAANAYYWHRFFSHQPDLNFDNPQVIKAVLGAMRFWLDKGVDGLRLDAIPYLCEREGTNNENLPETHEIVRRIRAELDARYQDRMLLGEANQWPEDVLPYFGGGDECHMAFHFPLMPRIFMAIAQEDRHPISDIMNQTPEIPEGCQWAVFLRNHDELTLEMVTDRERDYLWNFYASDPRMRINVGIRRRLAPLLENDRRRIELLNSLLMSMPGTPIIYYGDEIGMGDNIYLGDRNAVRTPMQWSPDRNAGFSDADPARLYLPPIMDPVYGYESVNVESQSRSSSSLLNWMKRLMVVRKEHPAFGRGTLTFLDAGNRKILAYLRQHEDDVILCVANLSRAAQPVELHLSQFRGFVPIEMMGHSPFPPIGDLPYFITLPGYGFYWFFLAEEARAPSWHAPAATPLPELRTLVLAESWASLTSGRGQRELQGRILPRFLANQRWFAGKDTTISSIDLQASATLSLATGECLLALYGVELADGSRQAYFLPLNIAWEGRAEDPLLGLLPHALARVRKGPRTGVLFDAVADDEVVRGLIQGIGDELEIPTPQSGTIRLSKASAFEPADGLSEAQVRRSPREQSNTSVLVGDDMIFKLYRRTEAGIHPEIEMGRYLTGGAGFARAPAFYGAIEHLNANGEPTALAILHRAVRHQGDGWTYVLEYLRRYLEEVQIAPEDEEHADGPHAAFRELVRTLGVRTAELHRVLARDTSDPAFRPEPVRARDLSAWRQQARRQAQNAIKMLRRQQKSLPDTAAEAAGSLIDRRAGLLQLIDSLVPEATAGAKTRCHGDYHLGQVLIDENDFYIIDYEGEPARSLQDRRRKHSPLRDVGGMVRSFDYAARTALREQLAIRPDAWQRLTQRVMEWEADSVDAFLEGYRETIGDCPSYPAREADARNLVRLFALEKACYEICYEAAHRPAWIGIPVEGALQLLDGRKG